MMQTRIAGIPCQVEVTHYEPHHPGSFFEPPSGDDIELQVYDRKGYRARWLEAKVTDEDEAAILRQHKGEAKEARDEARIGAYMDKLISQGLRAGY